MPELDPFDARLERAVHLFADRAETSVDAVTVAGRAMGRRPTGPWAVLTRAVPVPVPVLVASLIVVAFAGWSLTGGGPFPVRVWFGPAATPTAEPTQTPSPTPSPTPTIEPLAPAYVTGTGMTTQESAGEATPGEGDVSHIRGVALAVVIDMNDPRVTGRGSYRLNVDGSPRLGFVSGTFRLEAPGGAWEGPCTGSVWDNFTPVYDAKGGADVSCWLKGTQTYAGLTLYLNHRFARSFDSLDELVGTILPAEPKLP